MHRRFSHLVDPSALPRMQAGHPLRRHLHAAARAPKAPARALRLVRQCGGNSPLSHEELAQLRSIRSLSRNRLPGLHLLTHELEVSALQLHELGVTFGDSSAAAAGTGTAAVAAAVGPPPPPPQLNRDAGVAYVPAGGSGGGGGLLDWDNK